MIITTKTFARAGLIGNPSDGYFGKTISFTVRNFASKVVLYESPFLEIKLHKNDKLSFSSIDELTDDIKYSGYYGGIRLIKATIKVFYEYCQEHNINFEHKNFTISYDSNIPMRVGLAGSSAIVTSVMKALMEFYNVNIPKDILPNIILSVEKDELKIGAGLQDRVIQVFEDIVFMDFNKDYMKEHGFGDYEKLNIDKNNLPKFYIAYSEDLSEGTEVFHNNIRERYERGEKQVLDAMQEFAHITEEFKKALLKNDLPLLNTLINRNFDLRSSIYKISKKNLDLIHTARHFGASSKFCGSGGAIVGIYNSDEQFENMRKAFKKLNASIIKPQIFEDEKSNLSNLKAASNN